MRASLVVMGWAFLLGLSACGGDPEDTTRGGLKAGAAAHSGSTTGTGGSGSPVGNSGVPVGVGVNTGSGGSGAVMPGTEEECAKATLNANRRTPTILFVIDVSGSMCA